MDQNFKKLKKNASNFFLYLRNFKLASIKIFFKIGEKITIGRVKTIQKSKSFFLFKKLIFNLRIYFLKNFQ